jgi:two-component system cell cycle sensor histidine kinase/response regulator CckA
MSSQRFSPEQNLSLGADQVSALLDSSRELISILSADGAIQYASPAFTRVLGYRTEELLGRSIYALVHPQDVSQVRHRLRELTAAPGTTVIERCRLRGKDASWRWFEGSCRHRLDDPAIEGIVASYLDVTELHRMESERQVISDVVHALNQTSNLDQLLTRIHQALSKVLYAENCFVALYEAEQDTFQFPFFADQFDPAPPPLKVDRSCTAFVFRTGKAMLIPQSEFDRLAALGEVELVGSPSPAWLGVPLKTPTATIGVLVVQHYQNENAYDLRDLEFLDSVGGHIALAIERRRGEEALRKSESMFRLLFEYNPIPTWVFDRETLKFLQVNEAAVRQYGYSHEEFANLTVHDIRPEDEQVRYRQHLQEWVGDGRNQGHWKHRKKNGNLFNVESISHELEYAGRRVRLVVANDVTERQQLEDQLRQAQKMEAVGRLAGGVAHDFNNLLMVIKGHTELLLDVLSPSDHIARKIQQIDRSADRATSLTRQLLAFSRMQVLQPHVMNLNTVVEEMGRLLPRLIGENIELAMRMDDNLGTIRADASQMEQVLMNLAVNARDAMPDGGRLIIETSNAELDRTYTSAHPMVPPGRYVLLCVTDTGTGMDAETQAHIFEPFFTTKEKGKGTGLGLATVYGVVKQSGGFIWVYSELGKGTSFKIYLPRVDQAVEQAGTSRLLAEFPRGTETVLLAEDEPDVREVARQFLESGGYTVIEARDGAEALRLAVEHDGIVDLLITDMVMPGMTGQQLAAHLQQTISELRIIFMSGYSEHAAAEVAQANASIRLLTKPFSRGAILRAVRDALQSTPRG